MHIFTGRSTQQGAMLAIITLLASLLVLAAPVGAAHPGDTVFVDASNPDCGSADGTEAAPFCTIQEGVNHANDGDTVSVAAGTYDSEPSGQVQINQNNLTLEGAKAGVPAGPDAVPADRGSDESILEGRFHFSANRPGTTIDGFTIQSGTQSGINALRGVGNVVVNNLIEGTPAGSGIQAGILVQNLWAHHIAHNNIQGYRQGINADGGLTSLPSTIEENYFAGTIVSTIFFNASLSNGHTITGNVLENNHGGIFVTQGEHVISENTVRNGTNPAIWLINLAVNSDRNNDLDVTGNAVEDNAWGIIFGGGEGHTANDNCIEGNGPGEGLRNDNPDAVVDATHNWWGDASGPSGQGPGTGDSVVGNVDFEPWLDACGGDPVVAPDDPETKDDCKNGGWEEYGFRNQGQCIQFVNTGKDSR